MTNKIENISAETWAKVEALLPKYFQNITKELTKEETEKAIRLLYETGSQTVTNIIHVKSPMSAVKLVCAINAQEELWKTVPEVTEADLDALILAGLEEEQLDSARADLKAKLPMVVEEVERLVKENKSSFHAAINQVLEDSLLFYYWRSRAAFFEGGKICGVVYDEEKYNRFLEICNNLSWVIPYSDICITCANPIKATWDDQGRTHCDDGPAVVFKDGWQIWSIEGHLVDEDLVMRPEAQTLEEIANEANTELKRIRINRYGWDRYLTESQAEVIDFKKSPNGTLESLMRCQNYTVLCTYDPSTGRPYSLEVSEDCTTCEEAQRYLLGVEHALEGLGIECVETYPSVRT
jgi:hypothetical protein